MGGRSFCRGTVFRWKGNVYKVRRELRDGRIYVVDLADGALATFERSELTKALFANELEFAGGKTSAERGAQNDLGEGHIDQGGSDTPLLALARHRFAVIKPLLGRRVTRQEAKGRAADVNAGKVSEPDIIPGKHTSAESIYRWIRDCESGGGTWTALIYGISKKGGKGKHRVPPLVDTIITETIDELYLVPEATAINDVWDEVFLRIEEENEKRPEGQRIRSPGRCTIVRRIDELDVRERFAAKKGRRAAEREFSQYGQMEPPSRPLQRVEMDSTPIDLILVDNDDRWPLGRATLAYCLDVSTGYPLGYYLGFEPESHLVAMECLYHAILPKDDLRESYGWNHSWLAYGKPELLVVDNSKTHLGRGLKDACELNGIDLDNCPVKTPWFRAAAERHLGSFETMLIHGVPGTTFSNVWQKGDYDSIRQACISLEEFDKVFSRFIVDIYAELPHGKRGIPARQWERAATSGLFVPRLPSSAQDLLISLGQVSYRVIQHYGIDLDRRRYNAPELGRLRVRLEGKKVRIKFHPGDISYIFVYDPYEQTYLRVPLIDPKWAWGLSTWQYKIIREVQRQHQDVVNRKGVAQTKRDLRTYVKGSRDRTRRTRRGLARFKNANRLPSRVRHGGSGDLTIAQLALDVGKPAVALPPPRGGGFDTLPANNEEWEVVPGALPKSRRQD